MHDFGVSSRRFFLESIECVTKESPNVSFEITPSKVSGFYTLRKTFLADRSDGPKKLERSRFFASLRHSKR